MLFILRYKSHSGLDFKFGAAPSGNGCHLCYIVGSCGQPAQAVQSEFMFLICQRGMVTVHPIIHTKL